MNKMQKVIAAAFVPVSCVKLQSEDTNQSSSEPERSVGEASVSTGSSYYRLDSIGTMSSTPSTQYSVKPDSASSFFKKSSENADGISSTGEPSTAPSRCRSGLEVRLATFTFQLFAFNSMVLLTYVSCLFEYGV